MKDTTHQLQATPLRGLDGMILLAALLPVYGGFPKHNIFNSMPRGGFQVTRTRLLSLNSSFAIVFREGYSKLVLSTSLQKPWEVLKYYNPQNREKI